MNFTYFITLQIYFSFFDHGSCNGYQIIARNADGEGLTDVCRFGQLYGVHTGIDGFDICSTIVAGSFFEYGAAILYKAYQYAR